MDKLDEMSVVNDNDVDPEQAGEDDLEGFMVIVLWLTMKSSLTKLTIIWQRLSMTTFMRKSIK